MGERVEAPYGAWASPITAETVISAAVGLSEVRVDGDHVWWSEGRPEEGGRVQLVRDGQDALPDGFAARTRVHEYGGGAWAVRGGVAFFANWGDQRLYRLDGPGATPVALTPEPAVPMGDRYADVDVAPDGTWLVCVREHHPADGGEAVNELVRIPTDGADAPEVLLTGPDFVAAPRLSADGGHLAWIQWDHPNMPWDETGLWVASIGAEGLAESELVAGGLASSESVVQPCWSPAGELHLVSDRTGWWNLYQEGSDEPVVAVEGEIGTPPWVFGMSRYAFLDDGTVVAACRRHGRDELLGYDVPFTSIDSVVSDGRRVLFVGASPTQESAVVRFDPATGEHELLRPPRDLGLDPAWLSVPEAIEFPTEPGPDGEARRAHALYYPPTSPDAKAPPGERPPLLVLSHGGPTAAARPMLSLATQFWTSRGFAVVDVDYGGSTGYGREYRDRLREAWGIVDVADCVAAARFLAERGDVDPDRLCIRGG
ncbi:MAG TPA: prolyl oligopeptidase family serine peptidase, partial [Acidimicrobiales bacterium]|nr:prolyl oligopeptidase family serine peptidase [Acidimicrobiales bacterium]